MDATTPTIVMTEMLKNQGHSLVADLVMRTHLHRSKASAFSPAYEVEGYMCASAGWASSIS
jgi:hypothetical protein